MSEEAKITTVDIDKLTGLTEADVQERLTKFGYNEINEKEES